MSGPNGATMRSTATSSLTKMWSIRSTGIFEGKVVVVTGASTGVGRAIARAFGEEKAKVALIARTEEALNHAAEEITRAGGEAFALPVDVSDAQALEAATAARTLPAAWEGTRIRAAGLARNRLLIGAAELAFGEVLRDPASFAPHAG